MPPTPGQEQSQGPLVPLNEPDEPAPPGVLPLVVPPTIPGAEPDPVASLLLPVVPLGDTIVTSVAWDDPDSAGTLVTVVVDRAGTIVELDEGNNRVARFLGGLLDAPPTPSLPMRLVLYPAHPNPFLDETSIAFDLPSEGPIRLEVFDVSGRLLRTLARGTLSPKGPQRSAGQCA